MKRLFVLACALALVVGALGIAQVWAGNITIWDKVVDVTKTPPHWYNMGNNPGEDQEVEPNCVTGQVWDTEAFVKEASNLRMVGGWDFQNGLDGWSSGHVFVDIQGDAIYGVLIGPGGEDGNKAINNNFNYEWALTMDFANNQYHAYLINAQGTILSVYYRQNDHANPYQYIPASGQLPVFSGQMSYETGLNDSKVNYGLTGTLHNRVTFHNLFTSFPYDEPGPQAIFHFTQECGNDNLVGQVPIPGAWLLLGSGLVGLAGLRFRRK